MIEPAKARYTRALERANAVKIAGICLTVILVVVLLIGQAVLAARVATINDQGVRAACSDRLTADVLAAAGRALAAPPAPNPARDAAVVDIVRAADRLTHAETVCAHGVPAPLSPNQTR